MDEFQKIFGPPHDRARIDRLLALAAEAKANSAIERWHVLTEVAALEALKLGEKELAATLTGELVDFLPDKVHLIIRARALRALGDEARAAEVESRVQTTPDRHLTAELRRSLQEHSPEYLAKLEQAMKASGR